MNRRDVLKALTALPLSTTSVRLWAQDSPASSLSQRPKLLVVFLRGGYDCANVLVPVSSSFYYESRPNIAIAKPGSDANAALPLDAEWGLHPALRESILPLWNAGQAAFVPFAGIDDLSRSHFATQDSLELGQPLDGSRNFQSGFMNRLAAMTGSGLDKKAIAFTDQLPVVFRGGERIANVALRNVVRPAVDARQSAAIAAMYRDTPYAVPVNDGFAMRDSVMRDMAAEMDTSGRNAITANGFELEARRIARLMRDRYSLGFVDVGGWDTHAGEGGATGALAGRLTSLGRGLAVLASEMGPQWSNTTVVVMSEFGRTFRENGNRGTDHGHGSVYWVLGGSVRGGRVVGEQTKIDASTLFQNRDYPVLNEYRSVLGGLFSRMYSLTPAQVATVFAGSAPRDLGVI